MEYSTAQVSAAMPLSPAFVFPDPIAMAPDAFAFMFDAMVIVPLLVPVDGDFPDVKRMSPPF